MSTAHETSPIANGSLAATPFGHLALYLYRKASSGTLVVTDGRGEENTIQFQEGRAHAARLAEPAPDLMSGLLPLCGLTQGRYAFYDCDALGASAGLLAGRIDPFALVARAIAAHPRDDMVDGVLTHMGSARLRMRPDCELKRLELGPRDAVLIDLIRAEPASILELCEQSPLGALRTRRLLYVLIVTHMVVPFSDRETGEIYRSQIRSPSFKPPTSAASMRPRADSEVRESVRTSARPSRVPAWQSLASLRPGAIVDTPTDRPDRPSKPSVSMPAPVDASGRIHVRSALGRIDKHCQRGEYDAARALAQQLLEQDEWNADAHAARAYVLFKEHACDAEGLPREVAERVRRALELEVDNARALLTKGLVYKAAGELKKAMSCFQRAARSDRRNLEAQRELRLARMRAGG